MRRMGRKWDWAEERAVMMPFQQRPQKNPCELWSQDDPSSFFQEEARGTGLYIPVTISHWTQAAPGRRHDLRGGSFLQEMRGLSPSFLKWGSGWHITVSSLAGVSFLVPKLGKHGGE